MVPTILMKFCKYIGNPTKRHYRFLPKKSLKLEKSFLIFRPSAKIAPKPTDQSCSNSICGVPLQISSACLFSFWATPKIKGSSHKNEI